MNLVSHSIYKANVRVSVSMTIANLGTHMIVCPLSLDIISNASYGGTSTWGLKTVTMHYQGGGLAQAYLMQAALNAGAAAFLIAVHCLSACVAVKMVCLPLWLHSCNEWIAVQREVDPVAQAHSSALSKYSPYPAPGMS